MSSLIKSVVYWCNHGIFSIMTLILRGQYHRHYRNQISYTVYLMRCQGINGDDQDSVECTLKGLYIFQWKVIQLNHIMLIDSWSAELYVSLYLNSSFNFPYASWVSVPFIHVLSDGWDASVISLWSLVYIHCRLITHHPYLSCMCSYSLLLALL